MPGLVRQPSFLQSLWRNEVMLSVTQELTYASVPEEKVFAIPTRVLVELPSYHIIAFGHEARPVEHAGVKNAKVIQPCNSQEIFDQTATTVFLRAILQMLLGRAFLLKPKVYISQQSTVTPFMQELWQVCLFQAGAREVTAVHPLLATAAGAGLPVSDSHGYAVAWCADGRLVFGLLAFGHVQYEEEFPFSVSAEKTSGKPTQEIRQERESTRELIQEREFADAWAAFLARLPAEFRATIAQEGVVVNTAEAEPSLAVRWSKAAATPVVIVPPQTEVLGLQRWARG